MTIAPDAIRDDAAANLIILARRQARRGATHEQIIGVLEDTASFFGVAFESSELQAFAVAALAAVGEAPILNGKPEVVGIDYLAERLGRGRSATYDLVRSGVVPGRLDLDSQRIAFAKRAVDEWLDGRVESIAKRKRPVRRPIP